MPATCHAVDSDSPKANVEYELKIDKLTLLHNLPEMWTKGMVTSMIGLITDTEMQSTYGITGAYGSGCWGYQVSIAGRTPKSTDPLTWSEKAAYLLQVEPKTDKKPYLRLDINPEGLTPAGMMHLRDLLDGVFGMPWATWGYARVSRIDAALDLHGINLTDWAWDHPKRSARELICRGRELRTIYLGAKKASPLVIYNKAKQDPSATSSGVLTRIEYRFKDPGTVSEVASLPNPFVDLDVFDPAKLPYPDPHKLALKALGQLCGRRRVIASFPKNCRLVVEKELMKTEAA